MGKKRQSPAEDLMDLVAMLPWWGGVALALILYLVLHQMASVPSPGTLQPGQMAAFAVRTMIGTLASIGQFLIPGLCLLAALGSIIKRNRRKALLGVVAQSNSADALNGMSWREFELLVGEAFRLQGYSVTEQGGAGPDGGVDLVLRKGAETFLVQCKQWKAYKVGVDVVRQLYGVMAADGAAGGFVITSGTFTSDAQAFAEGRNVKLVDGTKLFGLIRQARASTAAAAPRAARALRPQTPAGSSAESAPLCPVCETSMVRRTAKKGANAGSQFWGCPQYPGCRGTR
jgi:restriction system protein